ncbi:hypothetical protein [Maricaulis maris]|uniref:hypothetical protein n=1 Tax=Maricaulis maris TaxID=74318 RepID=UPI003B8B2176
MDRRHFLLGGLAAATGGAAASADYQCQQLPNAIACSAGIPAMDFFYAQQACPNWCWAASIQMCLAVQELRVDQRYIVSRAYPDLACNPATTSQMNQVVNSTVWPGGRRTRARIVRQWDRGVDANDPNSWVSQYLANRIPVIVAGLGHAMVATRIDYRIDRYGRAQVDQITVRDPYPYYPARPSRQVLDRYQLDNVNYIMAVTRLN